MEYLLAGLAAWVVCGVGGWIGAAGIIGDWRTWDAVGIGAMVACGPIALAGVAAGIIQATFEEERGVLP